MNRSKADRPTTPARSGEEVVVRPATDLPETEQTEGAPETERASFPARRVAILVLGVHRSGTAVVTGVISLLGADLPHNLIPADPDNNEAGSWESTDVHRLNAEILASAGSQWEDWRRFCSDRVRSPARDRFKARALEILKQNFAESSLFVLNDPRICRLLPFWLEALREFDAEPKCVLPIGNPLEVAASRRKRDDFSAAKSQVIWLRRVLDAEYGTRGLRRAFVTDNGLLDDWRGAVSELSDKLDIPWPGRSATVEIEIDQFLVHCHRAIGAERACDHADAATWVKETYSAFDALYAHPDSEDTLTRLDRVRAEFGRASDALGTVLRSEEMVREEPAASPARIGELEQVVAEREARIGELERVVGVREAQVNVLRSSLSAEQDRKRDAQGLDAQVLRRLDAIQSSASWQLAGSLRALESRWPRFVRGIAAIPKLAWWALTLRLPQRLRVRRQASELLETGLFDRAWYVEHNADIILNGQNPVLHWLAIGWTEGRDPNPLFDTERYLEQNPDVTATGIDPLYQYLLRGQREVRSTGRFAVPRATFPKAMAERWTAELRADPAFARLQEAMPLASILMPTHNRAHILPRAIDSVLAQRWQRWELFVVDDHSTDGTADLIARRYADSRIRLLTNEGRGVCDARNRGLAESRGEFIAYLDSDNHWTPDYLELMLAELERSGMDSAYAVLMRITGPQGQPGTKVNYRYEQFDFEQLKFENYIDINVFMHRRRLYEDLGGFDPALKRMVDWDLILRYTRKRAPAQAMFIGVHYDASPAEDRITTTESASYLNVVRNKHWVDWERQLAGASRREPELVSIVTCVYGRIDLTEACLQSLFRHEAGERFELILVDNASDPETARRLREWEATRAEIRLIRNPENLNFALGNNVGFAASRGVRVVFLNNDIEVTPEWLRALVRPLADPTVLGVQPRLLYPDGTIQAIGIVFSDRSPMGYPIYAGQPGTLAGAQRSRDFAAVTAACVAFRAEDFARMRGFDPIYVNGQEDIDLCLRLGGGRPVFRYAPDSVLFHHESQSPGRRKNIESNRHIFHERWQGKVRADDHRYYAQDGIEAFDHAPDNPAWAAAGYAVWRPKLVALPGDADDSDHERLRDQSALADQPPRQDRVGRIRRL